MVKELIRIGISAAIVGKGVSLIFDSLEEKDKTERLIGIGLSVFVASAGIALLVKPSLYKNQMFRIGGSKTFSDWLAS
jgi:hypothetical protein